MIRRTIQILVFVAMALMTALSWLGFPEVIQRLVKTMLDFVAWKIFNLGRWMGDAELISLAVRLLSCEAIDDVALQPALPVLFHGQVNIVNLAKGIGSSPTKNRRTHNIICEYRRHGAGRNLLNDSFMSSLGIGILPSLIPFETDPSSVFPGPSFERLARSSDTGVDLPGVNSIERIVCADVERRIVYLNDKLTPIRSENGAINVFNIVDVLLVMSESCGRLAGTLYPFPNCFKVIGEIREIFNGLNYDLVIFPEAEKQGRDKLHDTAAMAEIGNKKLPLARKVFTHAVLFDQELTPFVIDGDHGGSKLSKLQFLSRPQGYNQMRDRRNGMPWLNRVFRHFAFSLSLAARPEAFHGAGRTAGLPGTLHQGIDQYIAVEGHTA